jgi:hypothetical protein
MTRGLLPRSVEQGDCLHFVGFLTWLDVECTERKSGNMPRIQPYAKMGFTAQTLRAVNGKRS